MTYLQIDRVGISFSRSGASTEVLRTVPPLAWLPLSLAAFRDGQPSATASPRRSS